MGNQASFSGADIQAPQINFTQTDPSKAGELILGGSINTTQTSHTEKNETAGVWQEMKGNGSTVQTLNQTSLNGTVSFDSALKITAQIPDTKGGTELKNQINALVTQGNGVGLDYLNALAANPNVQWDKVALANEHWNYSQQGLTGAGAALLTIVVTYFTMGMGTAAVGTTAATEGAAVGATTTTLAGTTLATTTAAGVTTYTAAGIAINEGDPARELTDKERADVVSFAKVIAATSGVISGGGGNNVAAVNIAATTGANAAENNYLTHAQALAKKAALEKAQTDQEKRTITEAYDKLDAQQKNEAAACLLKDQCSSVFEKPSLEATLQELNAACAAPRLCTPDEQKSILELKDFYATKGAIKPDTTIEEFLLTNKAITTALNVAKSVIVRMGAELLTPAAKPLGVVSDFSGNPVAVLEASSQYAFKTEVNIGATGANLENSAAQFVKDEAGKDFVATFDSKIGVQGIDLAYAKMVNGQPQLVIGEAKAGDSALTALGENYEKTLTRNLVKVEESIENAPNMSRETKNFLLNQLRDRTYQVELYTSVGNAAKTASRVDDVLINRMGQPVSRIVTFGKN